MNGRKTVLFLYTRLPEYVYSCLQYFVDHYNYDVTVIRYQGDANTKYTFTPSDRIRLLFKEDIDVAAVVGGLNLSMIVVSSWRDSIYKKVARAYRNSIPVVIALDNPYEATWRQRLLIALSPFFIHRFFNRAWVAGSPQHEYAKRLGFSESNIISGVYSADTEPFYAMRQTAALREKRDYPRVMVFVGRFVDYKWPQVLAKLFNQVNQSSTLKWTLILAGEGPLKHIILEQHYPDVKVMNFIAPRELPAFYQGAGVFCLPSKGEHWGVAVHEAAAAGLPLLLSDSVGSASTFMIDGLNGCTFHSGDEASFTSALQHMMTMTDQALLKMGEHSYELSKRIGHASWATALNGMIG